MAYLPIAKPWWPIPPFCGWPSRTFSPTRFKFTRAAQSAIIDVGSSQAEGVTFSVRDNGAGFDMPIQGQAVQAFPAPPTSRRTTKALASAWPLWNGWPHAMGVRAWAVGELGQGATFFVSFHRRARCQKSEGRILLV